MKQRKTPYNTRYKTLGFKWLFERSTSHQVRCNSTGKSPAIPNVSYRHPLAPILIENLGNASLAAVCQKI